MSASISRPHDFTQLSEREREWIEWILPADRIGYCEYRDLICSMTVIGEGRRGKGEVIFGHRDQQADLSAPLAPVFAYGMIETNFGNISITIRERVNDQISVEIVSHRFDDVPREFEEARRWTYSSWNPGNVCPQCGIHVREVAMHPATHKEGHVILAICARDRRLWVFDATNRVNRILPVTNYYNELMLHLHIRDPKVALDTNRLFTDLGSYSDADLTYAFLTYNTLKKKISLEGGIEPDEPAGRGFMAKLKKLFVKK